MRVYVASSWRNIKQPLVVARLRNEGHTVYDFKAGSKVFHWQDIDPKWQGWTADEMASALCHPRADEAFREDFKQLLVMEALVLVLPAGRSAHMEAGFAVGQGVPLIVYLSDGEPELMYSMASAIATTLDDVVEAVRDVQVKKTELERIVDRTLSRVVESSVSVKEVP